MHSLRCVKILTTVFSAGFLAFLHAKRPKSMRSHELTYISGQLAGWRARK